MKDSIIKNKYKIYSFIFWILIWSFISRVINNPILFPDPFSVILALFKLIKTKVFYLSIANSIINIGLGLILGIIIGIFLSILSYKNNLLEAIIRMPINVVKSSPIASIVIILLVWFKSEKLPIIVVLLVVVPTIYLSSFKGLNSVDKDILEVSRVFKVGKNKVIKFIYLDKLKEFLYPSITVATGLAFKSGISAEVMGLVKNSIGENIYYSKLYLDTKELFAWTISIITLSKILESIINKIMMRLR